MGMRKFCKSIVKVYDKYGLTGMQDIVDDAVTWLKDHPKADVSLANPPKDSELIDKTPQVGDWYEWIGDKVSLWTPGERVQIEEVGDRDISGCYIVKFVGRFETYFLEDTHFRPCDPPKKEPKTSIEFIPGKAYVSGAGVVVVCVQGYPLHDFAFCGTLLGGDGFVYNSFVKWEFSGPVEIEVKK